MGDLGSSMLNRLLATSRVGCFFFVSLLFFVCLFWVLLLLFVFYCCGVVVLGLVFGCLFVCLFVFCTRRCLLASVSRTERDYTLTCCEILLLNQALEKMHSADHLHLLTITQALASLVAITYKQSCV